MGPLSEEIGLDSVELAGYFTDPVVLKGLGFTKETILSLFIPNTYQMYWDISQEKLGKKMLAEYKSFWDKNKRREKANELGMNESEVYTLASIVEKESQDKSERPIVGRALLE